MSPQVFTAAPEEHPGGYGDGAYQLLQARHL
jgi:hypothetical protein